ncbi:DUF6053 domain-containing protein [Lysobacter enzymogenes]|uniref:DUF6053 domain-containing protein n=1 Tax=Lysobacter enzymogenes TaxID=69 RepID=UPI003D188D48
MTSAEFGERALRFVGVAGEKGDAGRRGHRRLREDRASITRAVRGIGVGAAQCGAARSRLLCDAVAIFRSLPVGAARAATAPTQPLRRFRRSCVGAVAARAAPTGPTVGGPSGPMPLFQFAAAIRQQGIGPEGPPTRQKAPRPRGRRASITTAKPAQAPAPRIAVNRARPTATDAAPRPRRSGSPGSSAPPVRSASPG